MAQVVVGRQSIARLVEISSFSVNRLKYEYVHHGCQDGIRTAEAVSLVSVSNSGNARYAAHTAAMTQFPFSSTSRCKRIDAHGVGAQRMDVCMDRHIGRWTGCVLQR